MVIPVLYISLFIASLFSEMGRGVASSEGTDFGGTLLEAYTPELKYT